jgi:hypothetical protein
MPNSRLAFGADFWFDRHVTPLRDDVTSLSLSGRGDVHCVRHSLSFRRRMMEGGTVADDALYWILDVTTKRTLGRGHLSRLQYRYPLFIKLA